MLEATDIALLLISVMGTAQAVFLIVLLLGEGKRAFRANRWLMMFAGSVGASFLADIVDTMVSPLLNLYLAPVFTPFVFAFLPSIYLYFREISGVPPKRAYQHFLVMVLIALEMIGVVYLLRTGAFQTQVSVADLADNLAVALDFNFRKNAALNVLLLSMMAAFCAQFAIYMFRIWHVATHYLRQADRQLEADRKGLRHWILELLVGLSLLFTVFTIGNLFDIFMSINAWLMVGVQATFVLVFFRMSHVIAANPALFIQPQADAPEDGRKVPEGGPVRMSGGARPIVAPDDVARIRARLDRVLTDRDLIFDPLLNMPRLASVVGVSPNQLSHVLNQHLGQSFFDFINAVRIGEASRLLIAEPDRTILDIAIGVGFNSKSTFNMAFKKITGRTPSAYRREKL